MTSQTSFTLNPSYSGPMVLAETFRKMKSNSGFNRMLSSYNKRFFVLDLNHCTFYYLPDKQSHFANSTTIPLANIICIKVTKQSAGLEEDSIWKHEFVITTKKKNFELVTDSKDFMDKMLFAFSNIINTKTNKPLFNWNQYIGAQDNQCLSSNLPAPKSSDASPQNEKEASPSSPEESPVDIRALQPEQRGELSAELTKIERNEKEEVEQSPSSDSDEQKENKHTQEGAQKKQAPMQFRRKGNSFAATRGKGFAVGGEQEKTEQKEAGSPKKKEVASPVKREQVESGQEQEEQVEIKKSVSPVKKGEKIEINVQMLNLERIDSETNNQEHRQVVNSSRDQPVRRTINRLAVNQKSASVKRMAEKEDDFVGVGQIEIANNKVRSSKCGEESNVQGQGLARKAYGKQGSFGVGAIQEASTFSLFKKQSEKGVEIKKSEKNDDDWDNEMFGDGKNQLSPLKPKNHEEKHMSSGKKIQSQLSQKRSEFVAHRQGTHNDWDDEL